MKPVGYQALIQKYALEANALRSVAWLLEQGSTRQSRWSGERVEEIYPARYNPGNEWSDHLEFALKHEGVNLEVLAALFRELPATNLADWIEATPLGRHHRIAWFLYEWLEDRKLPLPDLEQGNYIPVLDEGKFYVPSAKKGVRSRRHRVVNNLPGTPAYCPVVRRTKVLQDFEALKLDEKAAETFRRYPEELAQRAARYLYLKETKSSYAIEHETVDARRSARFVGMLEQAGKRDCYGVDELIRIQNAIVEERYAARAIRDFQNYVGQSLAPGRELVHYVCPRPEDISELMTGWAEACRGLERSGVHPVITAAIAGFGFVFLHPFEDGNGRLHRFLIHHALCAGGFCPPGTVFPVSAVMLKQMARYDAALEAYSREIGKLVEYNLDDEGAMKVRNETGRFYRYPDLTIQAEALFGFIRDTVDSELTAELEYLAVFDAARRQMRDVVDMPDRRLDLFIRICLQGGGRLSQNKRSTFRELTDEECSRLEAIVREALLRQGGVEGQVSV